MLFHRHDIPHRRWNLAEEWDDLLQVAASPPAPGRWRITPRSAAIAAARPQITRLIEVLHGTDLVDRRGLDQARRLLRDGTGPVYSPASGRSLAAAVADCVRALSADQARATTGSDRSKANLPADSSVPASGY
jgi:hypothetical protein